MYQIRSNYEEMMHEIREFFDYLDFSHELEWGLKVREMVGDHLTTTAMMKLGLLRLEKIWRRSVVECVFIMSYLIHFLIDEIDNNFFY